MPLPEEQVLRLVVAGILGALLGLERERNEQGAGLRTHALVSTASALIMLVSSYGFGDVVTADHTVVLDPSRVAAQVVSGIGFLGAGTIILRQNAVRGLTTAASVWAVAALGLACGAGMFLPAVAATAILLVILAGLKPLERRLFAHKRRSQVRLVVRRQSGQVAAIEELIRGQDLALRRLYLQPGEEAGKDTVSLELRGGGHAALAALLDELRQVPGVEAVSYGYRDDGANGFGSDDAANGPDAGTGEVDDPA